MATKKPSAQGSAQVIDFAQHRRCNRTIESLRTMVHEAEEGKLTGILVAAQYKDGDIGYIGGGSLVERPQSGVYALQQLLNKLLR